MTWTGTRVLITGAGGFIGSHLAERLVGLGAQVRALVHYNALGSYGWLDTSPQQAQMEIVTGDITDTERLNDVMRGREIVFHLAALIAIPYSYQAPRSYVRTNIEGTLNVLNGVRNLGVQRMIHTSTSEVYGTAQYVPIDEVHPQQGQSPYAASKIGADKMVEAYSRSFEVPVVTVRPFNTFGPRQSTRAIIPSVITQCLTGSVVSLGNLHTTRDLNYVANTVDGFIRAAEVPEAVGQTINLGSGREIAIGDLVAMIVRLVGREVQVVSDAQRVRPVQSEVDRLLADATRARTVLGWEPCVTLEDGVQRTITWIAQHLERYRPDVFTL